MKIAEFDDSGKRIDDLATSKIEREDEEWRQLLPRNAYNVARRKGTEMAFTGAYWNNKEPGVYRCACCGTALFSSDTKFDSGSGWPSFTAPIADENIETEQDASLGMVRTEVMCKRCDAHLGHLFEDGPAPTHMRYCINSAALTFRQRK